MKKTYKIYRWIARILCILAILFVSMFALDSFDSRFSIWEQIGAFLIHLTPSYILIACLVIAWNWEKTGGTILLIIGILFSVFVGLINFRRTHSLIVTLEIILMVAFPFIIAGALFLLSYYNRIRNIISASEQANINITENN
jgi:hypothetical protein